MMFRGAPGCAFGPSRYSSDLQRHLCRKKWCPCKDANWTVDLGRCGQDGRTTRHVNKSKNINSKNSNSTINSNNITTVNNVTINLSVDGSKILPSGSEAERQYLQQHAESIYKAILAGTASAEADILSRFIRETWCSEVHEKLNNVLALKQDKHEYIVLQMRDGMPQIETLAGKHAPEALVRIAEQIMHQFAVDTCGGHDSTQCPREYYGQTCMSREDAERIHEVDGGQGTVCQRELWGSGEHEGQRKLYWVNMRNDNAKPSQEPALMQQGTTVARVKSHLMSKKERKRVGQVVCAQLQQVDDRPSKKARIHSVVRH